MNKTKNGTVIPEPCELDGLEETAAMGLMPPAETENGRLGAIDIGSNSIRLVVAEALPGGRFRVLDEERETTRLAKNLGTTGILSAKSIDDTLAGLRRFKKIADGFGVQRIETIATCAVREAQNGLELLQRARDEAGIAIQVIGAEEEAELAYQSVSAAFDLSDQDVVIADLGGGSTEIIFVSRGHIEAIIPTSLGAVRLTETCGTTAQLFESDSRQLYDEIDRQLKRHLSKPPFVPQVLVGTGGTFTNLAAMLIAANPSSQQTTWGYRARRADVRHLLDRLQSMSVKQRRNVPGLNADRADIIVAGLAIVDRLMRRLQVNVLQVHSGGVREGLLLRMVACSHPDGTTVADVDDAIRRFAASCGVDQKHAEHVATLAGLIFDGLVGPFSLAAEDRLLLTSAARLQDVGYLINYEQHHKHSYQLIMNSRLPGFSQRDLELIANVARYHRGARPKNKHANFRRLRPQDQQRVRQCAAILRVAVGLDRSHTQQIRDVRVKVDRDRTILSIVADGDPEVDLWAARSRATMFNKAFETELVIHAEHAPAVADAPE